MTPSNEKTTLGSNSLATKLREEAGKSPTFNAMCHIFALRQRSRQKITLHSLQATMKKEGFSFTAAEYTATLEFMHGAGVGTLEYSPRGAVRALANIKFSLQSIGLAALAKQDVTVKHQTSPPPQFKKVPGVPPPLPKTTTPPPSTPKVAAEPMSPLVKKYPVQLVLKMDSEDVRVDLLSKLTVAEFVQLFSSLLNR